MLPRKPAARHYAAPDPRPRWDDPDMPVCGLDGQLHPAEKMQAVARWRMGSDAPGWRDDPTYDLRRRG